MLEEHRAPRGNASGFAVGHDLVTKVTGSRVVSLTLFNVRIVVALLAGGVLITSPDKQGIKMRLTFFICLVMTKLALSPALAATIIDYSDVPPEDEKSLVMFMVKISTGDLAKKHFVNSVTRNLLMTTFR